MEPNMALVVLQTSTKPIRVYRFYAPSEAVWGIVQARLERLTQATLGPKAKCEVLDLKDIPADIETEQIPDDVVLAMVAAELKDRLANRPTKH